MEKDFIELKGVRVHNLKNIDVKIPKNKLVVICGISGSGKSSLAFDTIYAEGQRRYLESLSSYARQFLGGLKKPEAEKISNLSPTLAINQSTVSSNPRSTVGTITEIYDYLRLLFARVGRPYCPNCHVLISSQTPQEIVEKIFELPAGPHTKRGQGTKGTQIGKASPRCGVGAGSKILILGPAITQKKGAHQGTIEQIYRMGFSEIRINGILYPIEEARGLNLDKNKKHCLEVVVGKISLPRNASALPARQGGRARSISKTERQAQKRKVRAQKKYLKEQKEECLDYVKKALQIGNGLLICWVEPGRRRTRAKKQTYDISFSELFSCAKCGFSVPKIEPRLFSFNSPAGACPKCQGLGKKPEIEPSLIINYNLSLAEGAVLIWHRLSRFSRRALGVPRLRWQLEDLSRELNFSLYTPVKDLPQDIINIVLYGGGSPPHHNEDKAPLAPELAKPVLVWCGGKYEGIIPKLERLYLETKSNYIRKEIGRYVKEKECSLCQGARLKKESLAVKVEKKDIAQVTSLPIKQAKKFFENLKLKDAARKIAQPIIKEILRRLEFLENVGVDYISLDRQAQTLSVGENQRIRLACQLGGGLSGVTYVLDEPTIGLHQKEIKALVASLKKLRDLGNTVIVVEHDLSVLKEADWLIEIGPGAGKKGGRIVFEGTFPTLNRANTLTGKYLAGKLKVGTNLPPTTFRRKVVGVPQLQLSGASQFNLKNVNIKIPLARLVGVAGVSGSGKSTLIIETLAKALLQKIQRRRIIAGKFRTISGTENLTRIILVDQSPIGRTPRSNPATYVGFFSPIRQFFAKTKEARLRGFTASHFSFNTTAGRCRKCQGEGYRRIEMYFLPDIYVECPLCKGKRFTPEVLEVKWQQKNIAEILQMEVAEAEKFFSQITPVQNRLKLLKDIGLGYIQLGQSAPTLSGGEAQRIKLAKELSSNIKERTLYILDEPTVGLHFDDIKRLLNILKRLVEQGNTVIIIEHNPDVLKECDWLIELGPQGGLEGGRLIFEGLPSQLKKAKTPTAKFL